MKRNLRWLAGLLLPVIFCACTTGPALPASSEAADVSSVEIAEETPLLSRAIPAAQEGETLRDALVLEGDRAVLLTDDGTGNARLRLLDWKEEAPLKEIALTCDKGALRLWQDGFTLCGEADGLPLLIAYDRTLKETFRADCGSLAGANVVRIQMDYPGEQIAWLANDAVYLAPRDDLRAAERLTTADRLINCYGITDIRFTQGLNTIYFTGPYRNEIMPQGEYQNGQGAVHYYEGHCSGGGFGGNVVSGQSDALIVGGNLRLYDQMPEQVTGKGYWVDNGAHTYLEFTYETAQESAVAVLSAHGKYILTYELLDGGITFRVYETESAALLDRYEYTGAGAPLLLTGDEDAGWVLAAVEEEGGVTLVRFPLKGEAR